MILRGDSMLTKEDYKNLLVEVKSEFPQFEIVKKSDSSLMKTIDIILKIVSFGQTKNFMQDFITTIGDKIYVPPIWDAYSLSTKAITVRHERVHMRQAKRIGKFLFSFAYIMLPFPIVFAYFRMKFEKEGYEESLRAYHEYYGTKFFTPALKESVIKHFTTSEYFWMWPWRSQIEKWYDNFVEKITKK